MVIGPPRNRTYLITTVLPCNLINNNQINNKWHKITIKTTKISINRAKLHTRYKEVTKEEIPTIRRNELAMGIQKTKVR